MNYPTAIDAHVRWVGWLWHQIQNREYPDSESVGRDDGCQIGKWLYGEGRVFAHLPEYQTFQVAHRKFHETAQKAVLLAEGGRPEAALEMLDNSGACMDASEAIIEACYDLFSRVSIVQQEAPDRVGPDDGIPSTASSQ